MKIIISIMVLCLTLFTHSGEAGEVSFNFGGGYTFYGPDTEGTFNDIYVYDVEFLLKEKVVDWDWIHLNWKADLGVIVEDRVHPKVFSTLIGVIPISKNFDFTLGGGMCYIYNTGSIDGIDEGFVVGTIRAGVLISDTFFIGIDHYSMVWRHDAGRNPLRFGITIHF